MFDLSPFKLLVLVAIALVVFGPNELPKLAGQAGRMLGELRRLANNATADLRENLGPEFGNLELEDLNPRTFVRKHLVDDIESSFGPVAQPGLSPRPATPDAAQLDPGEIPPFDVEAT